MSLIRMSKISLIKNVIIKRRQPHCFMFHTPMKAIKLEATIMPNRAGYQSPNFLIEGENTAGKLNTIHINPIIQTMEINKGLFLITDSITS